MRIHIILQMRNPLLKLMLATIDALKEHVIGKVP